MNTNNNNKCIEKKYVQYDNFKIKYFLAKGIHQIFNGKRLNQEIKFYKWEITKNDTKGTVNNYIIIENFKFYNMEEKLKICMEANIGKLTNHVLPSS